MLLGPSGAPTFRNLAEGYTEIMAKYPDIRVVFRNRDPARQYSLSPRGVFYSKAAEGGDAKK